MTFLLLIKSTLNNFNRNLTGIRTKAIQIRPN